MLEEKNNTDTQIISELQRELQLIPHEIREMTFNRVSAIYLFK